MSPNSDQYDMKLVHNNVETTAKNSVSVTIFAIQSLIVAKLIKSGPSKLFSSLACHQN